MMRRLLTVSPGNEPLWVRLYVLPVDEQWAAMLVGDEVPPPELGNMTGLTFFGATPEEAEREAKEYPGRADPANRARACAENSVWEFRNRRPQGPPLPGRARRQLRTGGGTS
jgi:hypothetical protein